MNGTDGQGRPLPHSVDLAALTEEFPKEAIKKFTGRGKRSFSYVEGHSVINRLNRATGNRWDFQVLRLWMEGKVLFAHVRLELPGLGSREHIGVQVIDANAGEDIAKGAVTDALKKAATLFGVAIELYGDDYEDPQAVHSPAPDGGASPSEVNRTAFLNVLLDECRVRGIPVTAGMKPQEMVATIAQSGGVDAPPPNAEGKYDRDAILAFVRSLPVPEHAPGFDAA